VNVGRREKKGECLTGWLNGCCWRSIDGRLKIISTKNFLEKGYDNRDRNARHDQQVITSIIASVNTMARRRCAKSKGEGRIQYKREIGIITWVGKEIYTQRFIVVGSSK
jgi:hypothetical protein